MKNLPVASALPQANSAHMILSIYQAISYKIRSLPLVKKYPTLKELVKYSIVGNLSNLLDFSLYIYLTRAFIFWREHYLTANLITLLLASVTRFAFHKHWTFRDSSKQTHIQYIKFITILIIGLALSELVLFLSVEHLSLYDILGKLIAVVIGTLITYYFTRTWVFGKSGFSFKN